MHITLINCSFKKRATLKNGVNSFNSDMNIEKLQGNSNLVIHIV